MNKFFSFFCVKYMRRLFLFLLPLFLFSAIPVFAAPSAPTFTLPSAVTAGTSFDLSWNFSQDAFSTMPSGKVPVVGIRFCPENESIPRCASAAFRRRADVPLFNYISDARSHAKDTSREPVTIRSSGTYKMIMFVAWASDNTFNTIRDEDIFVYPGPNNIQVAPDPNARAVRACNDAPTGSNVAWLCSDVAGQYQIWVQNITNLFGWQVNVGYDKDDISISTLNFKNGNVSTSFSLLPVQHCRRSGGSDQDLRCVGLGATLLGSDGKTGSGTLATFSIPGATFRDPVLLSGAKFLNPDLEDISVMLK